MNEKPSGPVVDPQLLFGISLIIGLILAWPSLASAMQGNTDIIAAGVRLLLSIAAAWAGGFFLTSLIGGYARTTTSDDSLEKVASETSVDRRLAQATPSAAASALPTAAAPALEANSGNGDDIGIPGLPGLPG